VVEAPLGLMALLTYLNRELGSKINGKIAKAFVDFDNYQELKTLLDRFKPQIIGIRTMNYYKDFFHQAVTLIRQWGFDGPLIAGGPYATSNTTAILRDKHIDIVVLGEGEITFCQLVRAIIKNKGKLPSRDVLKEIEGIAFVLAPKGPSPRYAREIILLDDLQRRLSRQAAGDPEHLNHPADQVYTMYTSGTTGTPKGTLTTHANVVRVVRDTNYTCLNKEDRLLQLSNYAFDGSVFDIYGALVNGGTLVMMKQEDLLDLHKLADLIRREKISVFFLTTALFNALVDMQMDCFTGTRKVLFGGEKISVDHTKKALEHLGPHRLVHVYGPTETTVYATYYFINQIDSRYSTIPIGKPISNTIVYIWDKQRRLLPIGISGELYIGGAGVAAGYLNQPELTQETFLQNPYLENDILYRTGDIGRWLQDGNIEFSGRIDHQVKLRGFRVEMGEIENRLLKYNGIKEAVAMVMNTTAIPAPGEKSPEHKDENRGEDKYICAYITAREELEPSELRKYLARELPQYMVPAYIVQLEQIPLNPNGKLDRKSLPHPRAGGAGETYAPPRHQGEKRLMAIWKQVLNMESVGIHDHFFEIGGHSLKAVKLINLIHKEFNVKLNFTDIFQFPTIAALYEHIRESNLTFHREIEPRPEKDFYQSSYSQKRLWVLYKLAPGNTAFNMIANVTLYEKVEQGTIKKVFETLVNRHESFRTYFQEIDGEPVQFVLPLVPIHIESIDLSSLDDEDREKKRIEHLRLETMLCFNLQKPPLFRAKLIKCKKECFDLIFTMHHIISDGWSVEILEQEFLTLYQAYKKGSDCSLKPLRIQYKDYAHWHNLLLADEKKMQQAKEFWENQLGNTNNRELSRLELPNDFLKKNLKTRESAGFRLVIPGEVIDPLRTLGRQFNASLFIVLLAGFNLFLSNISGQEDIVLAIPGAARPHEDLKNIVGFFVNTLILRNRVDPEQPFGDFLEKVRHNTLQVLEYQSYPLELICSQLKIKYPDISVFFNMSIFGERNRQSLENFESFHSDFVQDAKFDMVCYLTEYKNGIQIDTHYYKQLFKPGKIEKMMRLYLQILEKISRCPGEKVSTFSKPERKLKIKL
jgi:amino acid adenylation domain-containing protein